MTTDVDTSEQIPGDSGDDSPGDAPLEFAPAAAGLGPTGRPVPVFPEPTPLTSHGPARVIAMCNQKGGVGKTTTTINLGASLAEAGRKVLLVDFDPQGALSAGVRVPSAGLDRTIHTALFDRMLTGRDILVHTDFANLDLLPANIDLAAAEVQLVTEVGREQALARVLSPLVADYDAIIIDCQPSLGLLTLNALAAADAVIVPLECEFFAMRGVRQLFDTITMVQERINPRLHVGGILATMFDGRTLHSREVIASIASGEHGDILFHTVISRTVKFPDSTVAQEPVTTFAPSSKGADAYRQLAREVLARGIVR